MPENNQRVFEVDKLFENEEKSVALIILHGLGNRVRNRKSDITYQVVSGQGRFAMSFEAGAGAKVNLRRIVEAGDSVTVPRGTIYQDAGDLVMLATSVPPFDPEAVEEF